MKTFFLTTVVALSILWAMFLNAEVRLGSVPMKDVVVLEPVDRTNMMAAVAAGDGAGSNYTAGVRSALLYSNALARAAITAEAVLRAAGDAAGSNNVASRLVAKQNVGQYLTSTNSATITPIAGSTANGLILDMKSTAIDGSSAFVIKVPSTGAGKAFSAFRGNDVLGWTSFDYTTGGTAKPGFGLGLGSAARDTLLYRSSAGTFTVSSNVTVLGTLTADIISGSASSAIRAATVTGVQSNTIAASYGFGESMAGVRWEAAYQGASNSDAFASIVYVGKGVVLAGKRHWNNFSPNRAIFRSTDYGQTWETVANPTGITGIHVYGLGHDGAGTVCGGTGDQGDACVIRSTDYGATWTVVLTDAQMTAAVGVDVASVFSCVHLGSGVWLAALRNNTSAVYMLRSANNGVSWAPYTPTGLNTSFRMMKQTSDGRLVAAGFSQTNGPYVSANSGVTWTKTGSFNAWSGFCDFGDGVWLMGTYSIALGASVNVSAYRSVDYGATWAKTGDFPVSATASKPAYVRTILKTGKRSAILYTSCEETTQSLRDSRAWVTRDAGVTWGSMGQTYVGPHGNMNAVYESAILPGGVPLLACQPDSTILRSGVGTNSITTGFGELLGQPNGIAMLDSAGGIADVAADATNICNYLIGVHAATAATASTLGHVYAVPGPGCTVNGTGATLVITGAPPTVAWHAAPSGATLAVSIAPNAPRYWYSIESTKPVTSWPAGSNIATNSSGTAPFIYAIGPSTNGGYRPVGGGR